MREISDKKEIGLIVSYYLSRCNDKAVHALGYKNFTEAFKGIGDLINENPNNIKNMRDEFDPYFDNGRKGWYQRGLRASRQKIFDEFAGVTDADLERIVKKLLSIAKGGANLENNEILKDLRALIRQSTMHYSEDFVWQDVELTNEFKEAYEAYLEGIKWRIEYYNATSVITTPTSKNIFVPNQWFVIASYAVGVYSELNRYKTYFEKIANINGQRTDSYAKSLRDDTASVDKDLFIKSGERILHAEYSDDEQRIKRGAGRIWRFVTDYSWWSGQKTVDRGDFYLSVVLNMLNLVNASQGYVGDIVNAYGSDKNLMEITKKLERFTTNLQGQTYDIEIVSEDKNTSIVCEPESGYNTSTDKPHRISISAKSIEKLGRK